MAQPTPDEEAALDATRAPLLDHLIELRNRIIKSVIAFFVCFIGCFAFAKPIYAFLAHPLFNALVASGQTDPHMIFTAVYETFFTYVKVGAFGGLCIAFPYMAVQLWLFIAPGLYKHERNAFLPFLAATPVMFLAGASFVYFVMLPYALRFFLGYQTPSGNGVLGIELDAKVGEYLSFVMTLMFGFGLCFQMPVLLALLGRVGIVSSDMLKRGRRYAIVAIVAVAAVVTPPDVFSQLSLSGPLIVLYEASIWLVRIIEMKRAREEADVEAATRGGDRAGPPGAGGPNGVDRT